MPFGMAHREMGVILRWLYIDSCEVRSHRPDVHILQEIKNEKPLGPDLL